MVESLTSKYADGLNMSFSEPCSSQPFTEEWAAASLVVEGSAAERAARSIWYRDTFLMRTTRLPPPGTPTKYGWWYFVGVWNIVWMVGVGLGMLMLSMFFILVG